MQQSLPLVLETPESNLVRGMHWFQNTYTRRLTSDIVSGAMSSGRATRRWLWRAIERRRVTIWARAWITCISIRFERVWSRRERQGVAGFFWSSLAQGYAVAGRQRRPRMETEVGFELAGFAGTASGSKRLVETLERRASEEKGRTLRPARK